MADVSVAPMRAIGSSPLKPVAEDRSPCANAAAELVPMLLTANTLRSGLHPANAVSAAAALTGEFALRASGIPLPSSGFVPAEATNELLYQGTQAGQATAWMFLMHGAIEAGVPSFALPKIEDIVARIAPHADGTFPLSVPDEHRPLELPMNVGPRQRHRVIDVADAHDLSLCETTIALAAATAQIMIRTRSELPPRIGVVLAAETMLSVARLPPLAAPVTA